jgi:hypothetical protein
MTSRGLSENRAPLNPGAKHHGPFLTGLLGLLPKGMIYVDFSFMIIYVYYIYTYTYMSGCWYTYPSEKYENQLGL